MLRAFVACKLLRHSRIGEMSPKTQKGPQLAGRGAPHVLPLREIRGVLPSI